MINETVSIEEYKALKAKYEYLLDRVRRMRGWQIEYFKYRASSDLKSAKKLEYEVDGFLKTIVKEQQSKQQSIY